MAYVVSVTWTANEGEEEAVAAALERLREPTLAEDGVLTWIPHRDPNDLRVFYIYDSTPTRRRTAPTRRPTTSSATA